MHAVFWEPRWNARNECVLPRAVGGSRHWQARRKGKGNISRRFLWILLFGQNHCGYDDVDVVVVVVVVMVVGSSGCDDHDVVVVIHAGIEKCLLSSFLVSSSKFSPRILLPLHYSLSSACSLLSLVVVLLLVVVFLIIIPTCF
jgi:hypothetical protein